MARLSTDKLLQLFHEATYNCAVFDGSLLNLIITLLRFTCRVVAFLLSFFLVLPFVVVSILLAKILGLKGLNQWVLKMWSRLLLGVCGLSVNIYGSLPKHPVFIVANHVSWLDIPIIHSLALAGFVGKSEIKYWPILGWLAMLGDTVFIQRGNQNSRKLVINSLIKRLKQGRSVAVFPEGKVTDGGHLGRFHRPLLQAAVETKTPVVPIAIKFINQSGKRHADVAFINDEWFIVHVCRILTLPSCAVEIHCGEGLVDGEDNLRLLTMQARDFVEQKLSENDYLSAQHTT